METDQEKRKRLVWEIDRRLQEDQARPIVYHLRLPAGNRGSRV
jgi:peptide/nickel transport system substrate-binding protein